ncbi:ribonuclease III [Peptostreptococcus anaerobius]|uniref:Ribonuclease 3 n=1 Tax=Peptostreptococcus porci TaxID=2652282 RepID=A0A6N7XCD8_9FIRM|nr:ribonuclease III [Peptostreptococcus porci]MDY4129544.1 ribonuclease III [Peptostreptococcus porci]MST61982.1 ribonuclease III [Peptostreptococcus porci]
MTSLKESMKKDLLEFEKIINYDFKNKELLQIALTHSSFANEHKCFLYNERLEFLGDSVLGLVVSDYIFNVKKNFPEGKLTKIRATVVCEESLSKVAKQINIGNYLFLGKGEKISGGRNRISILADAIEAVIAAIYIDGGYECAKEFILFYLRDTIHNTIDGNIFRDYKTILQEIIQSKNEKLTYKLVDEKGPDHNKEFEMQVRSGGDVLGEGKGKNKKEAEKEAAKNALIKMGQL